MSTIILGKSHFNHVPSGDTLRRDAISSFIWGQGISVVYCIKPLCGVVAIWFFDCKGFAGSLTVFMISFYEAFTQEFYKVVTLMTFGI